MSPDTATGEECLKLTTYFGERDRHEGHLVADRLLDLYGEHRLRASILLRGAQGFGLEHHLRTDRLLTLSEDLPVVAVAVDTPARIEAVLGRVGEIQRRGLTTVEQARLVVGEAPAPGQAADPEQNATKLTVYLGRHERVPGRPAFAAVCELLHREGVAGASALLGVDGTHHGRRRRARFFARNARVPMMVLAVGPSEPIERALPQIAAMLDEPLFTLERVQICKRDGQLIAAPRQTPTADAPPEPLSAAEPPGAGMTIAPSGAQAPAGIRQRLTIVTSEATRHQGRAVHLELVRRLRAAGAAGTTSLRGIWGFHGAHAPHGDRLLALRRHVPVLTILIDTPAHVARLFPIVDELTRERGLVTCETVPASIVTSSRGCSSVG